MNTDLGISFWRVVNEQAGGRWSQVYAHIPFDKNEVVNKGALFGVVSGNDEVGWAERDAKIMDEVERYFNGLEVAGDLGPFVAKWHDQYPDLDGVWLWIRIHNNKRDVRLSRWGNGGIAVCNKGRVVDLSSRLGEGKVIKGEFLKGDKLMILVGEATDGVWEEWTDVSEEKVARLNNDQNTNNKSIALLIVGFGEWESRDSKQEEITFGENKNEDFVNVGRNREVDLVEDKIVGPIGWRERMINWRTGLALRWRKERVYVPLNPDRKKWSVVAGSVFLCLLILSISFGSIKLRADKEEKKWKDFSEPIEKIIQEVDGMKSVNPVGSKKIMEDLRTSFELGRKDFSGGRFSSEFMILEKKIVDGWAEVSGEKESALEEILRVDLVRQGFKGSRIKRLKDANYLILDETMGVVVLAETKTKDIKVVAGKGSGLGWLDVAGNISGKVMVMNGVGIRDAVNGSDLVKFDSAVSQAVAVGEFGNNLYVLDTANREIYKYPAIGSGFGDRTRWLKQGQVIAIQPVDMAMDVDIWLVSEAGQVERFRRGEKESFVVNNLPAELKIGRLAVQWDGLKIALLDPYKGIIVLCSKDSGNCGQVLKSKDLVGVKDIEFDDLGNVLTLKDGVVGVIK